VGGGESEYLEIASRIGWAGLAVFLLLNAVIIKLAMKGCRGHDRTLAMLSTIVLGITICIVIEQVVNRVWRHPFLPFEFAWVIGAWSTYYYLSSRQGRNPALARCD
jgi:hypothetical protein